MFATFFKYGDAMFSFFHETFSYESGDFLIMRAIVCIGESTPPQKYHPPLSRQAHPLNLQTVQAPLF